MCHKLANFVLIRILNSKKYLKKKEYDYALYLFEIFLINLEKTLIVFLTALLLGSVKETLIAVFTYNILRKYSFGWHALKSTSCTLTTLFFLVFCPFIIKVFISQIEMISLGYIPILIIVFYLNYRYAPADTEKNPLVSSYQRNYLRKKVLLIISLFSAIIIYPGFPLAKPFIILGMLIETLMITPIPYKLTGRSYQNYEKYETN